MNTTIAELQSCLEQEAELVGEFLTILQDEARVLEEGAAEAAMAETTARKNAAADALAQAARQRNALLADLGLESDGPGLLAATEAHPSLSEARDRLLDVTERARSLNQSNGRIVEVFLDHNQRAVDTLRRYTGTGEIYDASGRKSAGNKGSSRNIKA